MKCKLLSLIFLLTCLHQINGQTITVKKTCECTFDGNISSSVRFSESKLLQKKKYHASITAENIGSCDWGVKEVELRVKIIRCPSGSACQRDELIPDKWDLNESIRGIREKEIFIYYFEAPLYTGKFVLQYQLYYDNKPFGAPILTTIEILANPAL